MSKTETQSEALTAERRLFITAVANLELRKKFGDEGFRLDLERDELEALIEMAERASRLDAENKALRARIDPLGQVIAELRALTPEQLRAEMAKHKESDIAVALRELSASQEPLGDEFSKVLYENLDALQAAAKTGNAA